MPALCKKHGKPRTVIIERKMPKGGVFQIVGCADCAAAPAAAAGVKLETSKTATKPATTDTAPVRSKTLGERFGFKH